MPRYYGLEFPLSLISVGECTTACCLYVATVVSETAEAEAESPTLVGKDAQLNMVAWALAYAWDGAQLICHRYYGPPEAVGINYKAWEEKSITELKYSHRFLLNQISQIVSAGRKVWCWVR